MLVDKIFVHSERDGLQPAPRQIVDMLIHAQKQNTITDPSVEIGTVEIGDIILQTDNELLLVKPSDFGATKEQVLNILNAI